MKKVGIIGCGAIGTLIAEAVDKRIVDCDQLFLYDYNAEQMEKLKSSLHVPTITCNGIDEMIAYKPTVIVEAASQQAAREYMPKVASAKIDMIVMSTGALLDSELTEKIHVPSGAIGGLDAISSASLAGIDEAVLRTRKKPKALGMNNTEEQTFFEGSAKEAVKRFPKEMNVAATLALALNNKNLKVMVVSDPKVNKNVHEVSIKWKHGDMLLKFSNDPHPKNPKTSALAAWSAIKLLCEILRSKC